MTSPEYQSYWQSIFEWNSIFMFVPMMLGIVGTTLLITHFILKYKSKPSRPYLILIIAGYLLYFGIPSAFQGALLMFMIIITPSMQTLDVVSAMMYVPIIGFSFSIIGILLVTKSKTAKKLYRKYLD